MTAESVVLCAKEVKEISIYATLCEIQVEDEARGGAWEDAWITLTFQSIPNHINEQNGYGGPGWDEWLPAFVHQPDCQMRTTTYYTKRTDHPSIRQHCDESDAGAEPQAYRDCECGERAVFICDALTKKGSSRNGQEYVNPVLVLTGSEYRAIPFGDLLGRIEESVAERRGRQLCLEPNCTDAAIHTEVHRGTVTAAWCEAHDTAELWLGQQQRRAPARGETPG